MIEIKPKKLVLWLILRGFSITPSYTLINYALQSSAKLNNLCYGMGGTYIILVNHYCSICSCQVINFQIFLCSNFCSLFLELKNNYKHMMNSPQYIPNALSMPFAARNCHRKFADFSQFIRRDSHPF